MKKQVTLWREYQKGLWEINPIIKQTLGLCPALAVTVSAKNGIAMGLATTFVLTFASLLVSVIRRWVPRQVRIATHIMIIATLVTIVDLVMKAEFPDLSAALGPYIPLIVVNCLILGRQEMFASKNNPLRAVLDGLGNGSGFLLVLFLLGGVRELLGARTLLGFQVLPESFEPWLIMILPSGAFLTLGLMIGFINLYLIRKRSMERESLASQYSQTRRETPA